MSDLLTAAQMRAIETQAMTTGAVTGLDLMERAGRGVVEAIFEEWPELPTKGRAIAVCGPGNNGGDGFVVARLLNQLGCDVSVYFYGSQERLPRDARANYEAWLSMGEVRALTPETAESTWVRGSADGADGIDVYIDALFGIGLSRPLPNLGLLTSRWAALHARDARLVAVDVPSGIDTDTGMVLQGSDPLGVLPARLTVTFHRKKLCHTAADARGVMGRVMVKDIGL